MLNDDFTPMDFVVEVLESFFTMSREQSTQTMLAVHNQGFAVCGEIYGWGGMLDARDCSALVMEIYRCFGIMLPRNTSDLAKLPEQYAADVSSLSAEAKRETILSQPAGVILFFPGHVMIYYGSDGNEVSEDEATALREKAEQEDEDAYDETR